MNNLCRVAADGRACTKVLQCLPLEDAHKSLDDAIGSAAITYWQHLPLRKVSPLVPVLRFACGPRLRIYHCVIIWHKPRPYFWVRAKWNTVSPREQINNRTCVTLSWDLDRWSFKMESEEGRRGGELSDNALLAHLVFVKMEDLADRLKLLDYETRFCKQHKFKPFSRQDTSASDQSNDYDLANQNPAITHLGMRSSQGHFYDLTNQIPVHISMIQPIRLQCTCCCSLQALLCPTHKSWGAVLCIHQPGHMAAHSLRQEIGPTTGGNVKWRGGWTAGMGVQWKSEY